MKKTRIICLILTAILLIGGVAPKVDAAADQSVTRGPYSVDALVTVSDKGKMLDTAKAVILYERNSDSMVYTYQPDRQIYPSSMVKLMTVLLAIEKANLQDTVRVTMRALSLMEVGSVSAGLVAGEELSLEALLYCTMAASANDAAIMVAEYVGGSEEDFVVMMNQRAAELGMTQTKYTNSHGLHDPNSVTTARDICRLLDYALDNETFRAMFDATEYTIPATNKSEARTIVTTNHFTSKATIKKYYDERVTGGKTGSTNEAGRCLAITAEGEGMELLSIVMGAQPTYEPDGVNLATFGSFEETKELLDYAFENYSCRQLLYQGQALVQYPVTGGGNHVVAGPAETRYAVLPKGTEMKDLTWIYGDAVGAVSAPVEAGTALSSVQVWHGSKCMAYAELVAINSVPVWQAPIDPERMPVQESNVWGVILTVLGIILAIGLVALAVIFLLPVIRNTLKNSRRKNRRRDRRRSR